VLVKLDCNADAGDQGLGGIKVSSGGEALDSVGEKIVSAGECLKAPEDLKRLAERSVSARDSMCASTRSKVD
jgi:hypothetical protein